LFSVAIVDSGNRIVMSNSHFNELFPGSKSIKDIPHHEVRVDGAAFDFELMPLTDDGLSAFVGHETTMEVQLREQLVHMEKMGAIGRLVSGVAHELNNPLAGVVGYAQLLSRAELDPSTRRMVEVLRTQAERAGRIVQNFLSLASKTQAEKRAFDLNDIIRNVLQLREYDHSVRNILVSPDLATDLPSSIGDSNQIEQVILNLMINAEDAVATSEDLQAEILIRTHMLNDQIRLEVSDNGAGIRSRDMGRIFEPFFSTKVASTTGSGTGLGLNICAEIVKDHGGELYAWSTYGTGSTFTMELPAASIPVEVSIPQRTRSDATALLGKSVMVVDDEVTITELIDEFLVRCGASVDFYNSGSEAFDRLCVQSYDAIVCDQRMPGVNGQSLYRMVEALDPDLASRFIFVTGDVLNDRSRQFFKQTGRDYLRKPFKLEDLLSAVESVL
jgi:signal transduction histidine kinase